MVANNIIQNNELYREADLSAGDQIRNRVLEFLSSYLAVNNIGPHPLEIGDSVKLPPNYVNCAILTLLEEGIITQDKSYRVYFTPQNVAEPNLDDAVDIALNNAHKFGFKQFSDVDEALDQAERYFEVLANLISSKLVEQYKQNTETSAQARSRIRKLFFEKLIERFGSK